MTKLLRDTLSEETTKFIDCPSCAGMGCYDVGDCEDGVWEPCPTCEGLGEIEESEA